MFCPNTKCLGKLCLHKKTFQSLGRSDYQCPRCGSVCQVRNTPFEDQTCSFFLSLRKGFYFLEESPKSIQDVIGDVYCPNKYCSDRENCESLGGYVTTPRSIYGCGKCGAWLLVHKVPFMLQEHVKTTKTDKTQFFCQKNMNMVPNKQILLNVQFRPTNYRKKNCVWTTKYEKLLEMCIVQHVKMKSVFSFPPLKRLISTTVKSAKIAATFWIFLLRTKKRQLCCLAVTVHIVLQKRRVATTKKKKHLLFWRISTPIRSKHSHPRQNRLNWVQIWKKRIRFFLADNLSDIFFFQIFLFNFNLQSIAQS